MDIDEVSTTVEGDIDLMGLLGLDPTVRNGFQKVSVKLALRGADPEALRRVVEQSCARSAVLDVHDQRCAGVDRGRRRLSPDLVAVVLESRTTATDRGSGTRMRHHPTIRPAHDVVVVGARRRRRLDRHAPRPRRVVGAAASIATDPVPTPCRRTR